MAQKSHLQEFIESRGHICDFYPNFHPECNYIEQYWGFSKYQYRLSPQTSNIAEMEENVRASLDKASLLQIRRWANRSGRYISAYALGLDGAEATGGARDKSQRARDEKRERERERQERERFQEPPDDIQTYLGATNSVHRAHTSLTDNIRATEPPYKPPDDIQTTDHTTDNTRPT
ncbi:hypothetical protein PHLCEN_2v4064 [Hermanssonia centrifuga]|uniref:Uncharacterized protein n=1 Tax=Hermanssonia centrifuga TaxID=98765 RepID=A0A2R6Q5E0_9APHY|nr:hypothetical protein PHLCEN_2v4064 [Hermanssonia centrifuga]